MFTDFITLLSYLTGLDADAVRAALLTLAGFLSAWSAALVRSWWRRPAVVVPLSEWATLILQRLECQGGWSLAGDGSPLFRDDVVRVMFRDDGSVFKVEVNNRELLGSDLTDRERQLMATKAAPHKLRLLALAEQARVAAVTAALTRPSK